MTKDLVPYSPGLPVIGNLLGYQKDRLALLTQTRNKLGDRFRIKIGPKTLLVLTSPEDVKQVMHANMKNYYKRTNFDQLFGQGLFTTNDEEWKAQRKVIQPLFGPRYIESCFKIIKDSSLVALKDHIEKGEKDIYDLYSRGTFDIIIKTIIGIDYSSRFEELNEALTFVSDYLTRANYLPFELPLKFNSAKRKYLKSIELLDRIIFDSIDSQKSEKNRKEFSMISLLLKAQDEVGEMAYTDQRVRDNIITLMFAGFETSALTLSWLSSCLGRSPELQERLYNEIKDLDFENAKVRDFEAFPLLDAVVNEALRLYPAGWAWTRVAREKDEINGALVAPGEIILICPYLTHRDPKLWDDPNTFSPERFIAREKGNVTPFAFYPFGGGPRICVGKQFGTLEVKIMLSTIIKDYIFESSFVPEPFPMATLRAKDGFDVKLRKRK